VLDALDDLAGLLVLDVGAGTGIATRLLLERGALVVAVDPSPEMLGRARRQSPDLVAVVGDGARLPVPDGAAALVTFAQSWHWLDPDRRIDEVHRVLRPGGRWAAWWTHARGADWVERSWDLIEAACPGVVRTQRDTDWGAAVAASGRFDVGDRITVGWERTIRVDEELVNTASHSYVAALDPEPRAALLADLRRLYDETFPGGTMTVPLETWLWIGRRVDRRPAR
jgi:SAM-dependent methyltransferase